MQDCGGEFDADSRALLARIGEIVGAYDLSQQSRQLSWVQQQLEQGAQRILQESAHEKGCTPLWVRCWGWRCAF